MEQKKEQPARKLRENVADASWALFPMKKHKAKGQWQHQNKRSQSIFLELTIAILVKLKIFQVIFFLYIWYSLVFTNFGIFPLY